MLAEFRVEACVDTHTVDLQDLGRVGHTRDRTPRHYDADKVMPIHHAGAVLIPRRRWAMPVVLEDKRLSSFALEAHKPEPEVDAKIAVD